MNNEFYSQERQQELNHHLGVSGELSLGRYAARVFGIMFLGLLVTFVVGYYLAWTKSGFRLLVTAFDRVPFLHLGLMVAELVLVFTLSSALQRLSPAAALALFFAYALLTGCTFGVIFLVYDVTSLVLAFGATALYFGGMAVFGWLTQIDLTRIRVLLTGGLIFLIVMNLLMLFIPGLQAADHLLCTVGVVVFLGLTAYDTQKIKGFYQAYQYDQAMLTKVAALAALQLYLDFVNLFLYVLRFLGRSKRR